MPTAFISDSTTKLILAENSLEEFSTAHLDVQLGFIKFNLRSGIYLDLNGSNGVKFNNARWFESLARQCHGGRG